MTDELVKRLEALAEDFDTPRLKKELREAAALIAAQGARMRLP